MHLVVDNSRRRDARPWLLLIAAVAVLLDRLSKLWIASHIGLGHVITLIPGVFRLTHVLNTGAAFSLFIESASPLLVRYGLIVFSTLAIAVVLTMVLRMGRDWTPASLGLALILGGAIGNLYDRIKLHSVIDFLEVKIIHYHWPDFNVADSCICIGAGLLMIEILWPRKTVCRTANEAA